MAVLFQIRAQASSLFAVRGRCSNTRKSPVRAAGFREEWVRRDANNLAVNEPCEPPAGLFSGLLCTAAQAAFDPQSVSRRLQFHDTAFSEGPGRLVCFEPGL